MALLQLTIIPMGTATPSVSSYIADVQHALDLENITYKLTDMGTVLEGEAEKLLAVAAKLHELPFTKGIKRVVTHIVIDDRRDKKIVIGDKINSVKDLLASTKR